MKIIFSQHALFEMGRRDLTEEIVKDVVDSPGQSWEIDDGRFLYQKRIAMGTPEKLYLVRVITDTHSGQIDVVTAYRTSKIEKYWKEKL